MSDLYMQLQALHALYAADCSYSIFWFPTHCCAKDGVWASGRYGWHTYNGAYSCGSMAASREWCGDVDFLDKHVFFLSGNIWHDTIGWLERGTGRTYTVRT